MDPALTWAENGARVHALLHTRKGVSDRLKASLAALDAKLLEHITAHDWYVSLPPDRAKWSAVSAVDGVTGLSAIVAADRLAPSLGESEPELDAELSVEFFADVDEEEARQLLRQRFDDVRADGDHTFVVSMDSWTQLELLSHTDGVKWVEEQEALLGSFSQDTWDITETTAVYDATNFSGSGLVVAIGDFEHVAEDHPAMGGRVVKANAPVGGQLDFEHANRTAAIMVADGTTIPVSEGYLPNATLYSYRMTGVMTTIHRFKGIPEEARDVYGAALINNSWGSTDNCNKIGEYTTKGKRRDQAVRNSGILIVDAAGNRRGPGGSLAAAGCSLPLDLSTLPHTQAKNDLMVGNWDISLPTPALNATSAAGPTADGRLKPDLVAPGNSVATVDYIEDGAPSPDDLVAATHTGTSAAAPVASGIAGLVYEQLLENGATLANIPADQVKAILLHTAKDVGLAGPDFRHGYGLIQAAPAVRIADEWSQWGRNGELSTEGGAIDFNFVLDGATFTYKATLAWTDVEGNPSAAAALVNDLDLTLISPSGTVYYPWDLTLPAGDSVPATAGTGADRLNNVEQVLVSLASGDALEPGVWTARVTAYALAEAQPFSLVLTPPCPLQVSGNMTLTGPLNCDPHPLAPAAVEVIGNGATLDCDQNTISVAPAGSGVGIVISADDATVKKCTIQGFRTGINTQPASARAILRRNVVESAALGLDLQGTQHELINNTVVDMLFENSTGARIDGDSMALTANVFGGPGANGDSVGVEVLPGSEVDILDDNDFFAWGTGARLRSGAEELVISEVDLLNNDFEGVSTAIVMQGNVELSLAEANTISVFDTSGTAIVVEDFDSALVHNAQLVNNDIFGSASAQQTGILLKTAVEPVVRDNTIVEVGTGIVEDTVSDSEIDTNTVMGSQAFWVTAGIRSTGSTSTRSHITGNPITRALTGIAISGPGPQRVSGNFLDVFSVGVSAVHAGTTVASSITGNDVLLRAGNSAIGVGFFVEESPNLLLQGNTVVEATPSNNNLGISVIDSKAVTATLNTCTLQGDCFDATRCDELEATENTLTAGGAALSALGDNLEVSDNTSSSAVGFRLMGDAALVERNTVNNSTSVGIHLASGIDGTLRDNTVTATAGVSVRLGTVPLPCPAAGAPIAVDNTLLEGNTLSGGSPDLEELCDVANTTVVP